MKKLFYLLLFFTTSSLFFSSCKNEAIEAEIPITQAELIPNSRILIPQGNDILFVASPKQWYATDCLSAMATCRWLADERICEMNFTGTVDSGLIFIEDEYTRDVLFTIETYEQTDVIGFRFKGFSSYFLAESAANGDDGSTFTVEEHLNLREATVALLGYESIELQEGQYDVLIDPATNEKVVYISAILE